MGLLSIFKRQPRCRDRGRQCGGGGRTHARQATPAGCRGVAGHRRDCVPAAVRNPAASDSRGHRDRDAAQGGRRRRWPCRLRGRRWRRQARCQRPPRWPNQPRRPPSRPWPSRRSSPRPSRWPRRSSPHPRLRRRRRQRGPSPLKPSRPSLPTHRAGSWSRSVPLPNAGVARETRAKVEKLGLRTYTQAADTDGGKRIRVRLGPFSTRDEADQAAAKVKAAGLPAAVLVL